jgi:hypothetical protein
MFFKHFLTEEISAVFEKGLIVNTFKFYRTDHLRYKKFGFSSMKSKSFVKLDKKLIHNLIKMLVIKHF